MLSFPTKWCLRFYLFIKHGLEFFFFFLFAKQASDLMEMKMKGVAGKVEDKLQSAFGD
jgi:hypothetical protein